MPDNLLQTGGAGGIGALIGTVLSALGYKSKIETVDKRVDRLSDVVQYKSTCDARFESIISRLDQIWGEIKKQ